MTNERSFSESSVSFDPLEIDVYRRNETNILRLKDKLPENLVVDLAREVIRRVASTDTRVKHIAIAPSAEELEALSFALISDDETAAATMIKDLRTDGVASEAIYLKHLAGAARLLGEWWTADKVNFTQVTFASGRMFAIMRSMKHLFEPSTPVQDKLAMFASVPGENHTIGVRMAADLFRKDGWDITLKVGLDHDALVAEIEKTPSGIIGLSISGEHSIDALSRLVVAVRICCPHALLFVSGQDVEDTRPILELMGFDGIAGEIEDAKQQLTALWEQTAKPSA